MIEKVFNNMVIPEEFCRKATVGACDVGPNDRLRLDALLRMCQETSDAHLSALGIGFDTLMSRGLVFLIITNSVKITRLPRHFEEVTVKTHPRGCGGVMFYRDFVFCVGEEVLLRVMQSSVAASPEGHKILRPKVFFSDDFNKGIFSDDETPKEERLSKLRVPEDLKKVGERPVRYSDIDRNDHLTNTMYASILADFIPSGARGKDFTAMQIDYLNESFLGESLQIYAREENNEALVCGRNPRGDGFSAFISWGPPVGTRANG